MDKIKKEKVKFFGGPWAGRKGYAPKDEEAQPFPIEGTWEKAQPPVEIEAKNDKGKKVGTYRPARFNHGIWTMIFNSH